MASTASLFLVLSSLSLQAMALQERRQLVVRQRLQAREDRLQAAAQAVAGSLQRRHRCLIALPVSAWQWQSEQPGGCAQSGEVEALLRGPLLASQPAPQSASYTLLQYCPQEAEPPAAPAAAPAPAPVLEAHLLLEIEEDGATYRSASRLLWSWGPGPTPRLRGFQHLGLRSAAGALPPCPLASSEANP
ncbi:hypothetical protein [Cyanobium sp. LEGE 06113]|uniref:hypothetical protein n=1 Tax=Cyanobium sp. LEGE 06113 TaxID=1297573 RepID=UPI00187F93B4|nr:hypothetical protein [Cyanobium sp. LEGE 06113]MBE9152627.1 hypothetical protein [Cyanobium sp. LEGE 06113]MBE9153168.1 hypothetical protein [Cyanobium sp. LEGE 06113]